MNKYNKNIYQACRKSLRETCYKKICKTVIKGEFIICNDCLILFMTYLRQSLRRSPDNHCSKS